MNLVVEAAMSRDHRSSGIALGLGLLAWLLRELWPARGTDELAGVAPARRRSSGSSSRPPRCSARTSRASSAAAPPPATGSSCRSSARSTASPASTPSASSRGRSTRSRCSRSAPSRCSASSSSSGSRASLPLNPTDASGVPPALAFNTAVSFVTNTNWQNYGGESTMSHLTQMAGLTVQNFVVGRRRDRRRDRARPRARAARARRRSGTSGST